MKFKQIDRKPTVDDPCGTYVLIRDGLYWGHFWVGFNWCREKYVAPADPRDGIPW